MEQLYGLIQQRVVVLHVMVKMEKLLYYQFIQKLLEMAQNICFNK